jgi:hypothetical protein
MGASASTAGDIITGALLNINSYSPGEPLQTPDATTGLNALNDLLDSLSNDDAFVYTQQETLFPWIAGQFQYSVGNPVGGTFVATVTGGSAVLTSVIVPPNLIVNGDLTDVGASIPAGTTVLSIGTNTVTMSAPALNTPAQNPEPITYTTPGNIKMGRPLRFRSGFSRAVTSSFSNLDYSFTFTDFDNYKRELLKNVQGPWPYIAAYQPTFPLGTIYVYPAPGSSYVAHIFSDIILSEFAGINSVYSMPQGYTRALKKLLALELAPTYGKTPSPLLITQAKEAKKLLQGTNSSPVRVLQFDTALARTDANDASWAQTGGFT